MHVRPNVRKQRRYVGQARESFDRLSAAASELSRSTDETSSDRTRRALAELRAALRSQINGAVPGASFD
jgi:hypothetical protein